MAVVDIAQKTITLKIVYYGCALGGKTTNLQTLHRMTDPGRQQSLVTIATNDDRTLFFDLLPMNLGKVGGLDVKVKLYTVPGQVHYELTRRQVLAGADGVVLVIDSTPEARQQNTWALENLRFNLRKNGLDPERLPMAIQWNKRDMHTARPVEELRKELNARNLPEFEAVATNGAGVFETFGGVLTKAIAFTYAKNGRSGITEQQIGETVTQALQQATSRQPGPRRPGPVQQPAAAPAVEHRCDVSSYRPEPGPAGRDRQVLDQESLLAEAVNTNMVLAEKLGGFHQTQTVSERRASMMGALARLAPLLAHPSKDVLAPGLLAGLLQSCGRRQGSLLVARQGETVLEEREIVPGGQDPLNKVVAQSLGSVAHRLLQTTDVRVIEDLAGEVFFGSMPPDSDGITSVLIAPLACDDTSFGAFFIYVRLDESSFDPTEREFWTTAAQLIGLSLHWRSLRRKLTVATP